MDSEFAIDETVSTNAPSYTLHPVRGVVWAAVWGSPLAAGIVIALNYARMGNRAAARTTVVVAVAATVALFALAFVIPDDVNIPNAVFFISQLFAMYAIANGLQGEAIRNHARHGGTVASGWPGAGIGMLCLPLLLVVIFGVAYLLEPSYGTAVEFGNDEVYYAGDATEADARKLAHALQEIDFFGSDGASVKLESASGRYTVSFVLAEGAWEDAETVAAFRIVGRALIDSGFSAPLTIQLCDEYLVPHETIVIQ